MRMLFLGSKESALDLKIYTRYHFDSAARIDINRALIRIERTNLLHRPLETSRRPKTQQL